ncbi:MAG: type II secretion system protein GspG [Oligoflexia bacterium]|nr:type II secretion system protein GspG [Oligoflexia bacterium]
MILLENFSSENPHFKINKRYNKGYTFVEFTMVILLIAVLTVGSISVMDESIQESKFDNTIISMHEIRKALVGDVEIKKDGIRTSFGILGDIGSIPQTSSGLDLSALVTKPASYQSWMINSDTRFGHGWNGPYLSSNDPTKDYITDAWGSSYIYTVSQDGSATIVSLGADKAVGGEGFKKDITVKIPLDLIKAESVTGVILDGGQPYIGKADVNIYYPNGSGVITSTKKSLTSSDLGYFVFDNIPYGTRFIKIFIPDETYATKKIQALFTVDKINFVIPSILLDANPSANNGSAFSCTTSAGKIAIYNVQKLSNNITAKLTINSAVTLAGMRFVNYKNIDLTSIKIGNTTYGCSSVFAVTNRISVCPFAEKNYGAFGSTSWSLAIDFDSSLTLDFAPEDIADINYMQVEFTYTGTDGCDLITIL